ncbi:MAG: TylF/MycF/NovP-related O-methyltransferase [Patescibacteria group bacterium]
MKRPFLLKLYYVLSVPVSIFFILSSKRIHPAYRMNWWRCFDLGFKMFRNSLKIPTATSYKAHLAMALKLLELSPDAPGCVVECGAWKGGSTANLSLACQIVGRQLYVFDSFEGLPPADSGDREAVGYRAGDYDGSLTEVRENVGRYGALLTCEFVKGWFKDTLPKFSQPIALAFLDVDLEASLHTCVKELWPRLIDGGYLFTDECTGTDYTALFYSEKWWAKYFNATPPGLIGAGTGLPLGEYYVGPLAESADHPLWHASTGGYTRKGMSGVWAYYPSENNLEVKMEQTRPKVAILGATGMLGSAVYSVLKDKYPITLTYRDEAKLRSLYEQYGPSPEVTAVSVDWMEVYKDYTDGFQGKLFGPRTQAILDQLKDCDWVINAVGIIKPHSLKDPTTTLFINGSLPHILAAAFGSKLIHITTDCVYDGATGAPYDENSPKRPVDLYGISKLMGEPESALVIRTSIIGPELGAGAGGGLLGWFLSQGGQTIKGFTNHQWNGITTKEFGNICDRLISGRIAHPGSGIYHVFSDPVSKYEMVTKFKERFKVDVTIEPFAAPVVVDRRLATIKNFNSQLQTPTFDAMVDNLAA